MACTQTVEDDGPDQTADLKTAFGFHCLHTYLC